MKQVISKRKMLSVITKALNAFYDSKNNEYELIERGISEWAIAFRFGLYLNKIIEEELNGYYLDSEFNRLFNDSKEIFCECPDCNVCSFEYRDKNGNKIKARPDFIIHKRIEGGHLCCIEIKKGENDIQHDIDKLTYLTCPQGKYQYSFGIILRFFENKEVRMRLYVNGNSDVEKSFSFM